MILINSPFHSGLASVIEDHQTYMIIKYNKELYHIFKDKIKNLNVQLLNITVCVDSHHLCKYNLKKKIKK